MRHTVFALAASALIGGLPLSAQAESTTNFRGLFEGIDPADGSLIHVQITCDEEGLCTVRGADTFFSLCSGSDGRGLLEGTGRVDRGVLVVDGYQLTCADGTGITLDTTFTPDAMNETLTEMPDDPEILPITYHRISRPLGLR